MLFPTHLVAGYILGKVLDLPVPWVIAGAALPDLLDKSLPFLGFTDLFHTVGHSLITLVVLLVLARFGRRWLALWVGWASHLFLDAIAMILNGRPEDILFLLWPLVLHEPAVRLPPLEFFFHYVGTPAFFAELLIWAVFFYLLVSDRVATMARSPDGS